MWFTDNIVFVWGRIIPCCLREVYPVTANRNIVFIVWGRIIPYLPEGSLPYDGLLKYCVHIMQNVSFLLLCFV